MDQAGGAAAGIISIIIWLAIYAYFAICLQVLAGKTGTPNGWLGWIPIVNLYLLCKIGDKPGWWLILFFIPLLNIIMMIIVWMAVAARRGKASWLGILMIIPLLNLIIPGYLAFSE